MPPRLILFNKPFGMLSQFTDPEDRHPTLQQALTAPGFRPAGRLDHDSEGLLVLTDQGLLQARIADPRHKLPKTYWVQVEGDPDDGALEALQQGVELRDGLTRPSTVRRLPTDFTLWPRDPPIRFRAKIPTTWIEVVLREGRNRQIRRMTAAVGYPTLRLVRAAVGPLSLDGLGPWESRTVPVPTTLWSVKTPSPPARVDGASPSRFGLSRGKPRKSP